MSIKITKITGNKKNFNWKPVSEYTGGRVLATNDVDILVGYINSDGDCESEDCEGTLLCGITGFVEIEDVLPSKKKERICRLKCPECETVFSFSESDTLKQCRATKYAQPGAVAAPYAVMHNAALTNRPAYYLNLNSKTLKHFEQ